MKKNLTMVSLIVIMLVAVPQVFAMEMEVTKSGAIHFYGDSILGRQNGQNAMQKKPIETTRYNKIIHVEEDQQNLRVDLKGNQANPGAGAKLETMESSKVDRLKIEFPYGQTEKQQGDLMKRKVEGENEDTPMYKKPINEEHFSQLKEQRAERVEEKIQLRNNAGEDGMQKMEFESMGVTARLKNADFNYDPKTGAVTLTTPSGNEHVLNHLPDQAIERMKALHDGSLPGTDMEVETNEDGVAEYKAKGSRRAKLLGIFSREVETEVVLNDETGEIVENDLPAASFLGRFLDRLTL